MIEPLYSLALHLALPGILLRLWWRGRKSPAYRERWRERFGFVQNLDQQAPTLWLHAVSLGETIAATPLVEKLLQESSNNQALNILITNTTPTGAARVQQVFGNHPRVFNCYVPYDLPWSVSRFLARTQPLCAIFMETEIWPNTLKACTKRDIPCVLANARLSQKSAAGYGRFPVTSAKLLSRFSVIAAQNAADADRFLALGAKEKSLSITGSIKFDITLNSETQKQAALLKQAYSQEGKKLVWIAASTHQGEEAVILAAHKRLLSVDSQLRLLLVPRHPERFEAVFELCQREFCTLKRSSGEHPQDEHQVILGDTVGEMMLLYGASDIAFVGGSLIQRGGHNMVEPAYWAMPILSGPHVFNFADISAQLVAKGGMKIVSDLDALVAQMQAWLTDESERKKVGERAKTFAEQNRGALNKLCQLILQQINVAHK